MMPEQTGFESELRSLATRSTWDMFRSDEGPGGETDRPAGVGPIALHSNINYIKTIIQIYLNGSVESRHPTTAESRTSRLILDALVNASEALLASKRRGRPVHDADQFFEAANDFLAHADGQGTRTNEYTPRQIARRLVAARPQSAESFRPVTIDEQGRVFDAGGRRLMEFDPEQILKGRREVEEGRAHSLESLRAGDAEDGR